MMTGHSFRTSFPEEMIRHGDREFVIQASFCKHGVEQSVKIHFDGKKKQVFHNEAKLCTNGALLGHLQGVILTPDHIQLVKGGPQIRRHYLDLLLAQIDPLYVHHLTRYTKALKQRNLQLKERRCEAIDVWEEQMAYSATFLTGKRQEIIDRITPCAKDVYYKLAGEKISLGLIYKPFGQAKTFEEFSAQFKRHRAKEMEMGYTMTGPHRDDFLIGIGDNEARNFASEGQKHTLVAALFLAKWHIIQTLSDALPLLLIDDVGVGLDATRRKNMMEYLETLGQVVLTSTEE